MDLVRLPIEECSIAYTPSSSPVLQVLMNEDLLSIIFGSFKIELGPITPGQWDRPSLVACARVCHAFYGPAINLLWREMNTIVPLWDLLAPPGCCTYRWYDGHRGNTIAKRVASLEECIFSVGHPSYYLIATMLTFNR